MINKNKKIKKMIFAILAAAAEIPLNPKKPAASEIINNKMISRNILSPKNVSSSGQVNQKIK
jgi:hypothetical protein